MAVFGLLFWGLAQPEANLRISLFATLILVLATATYAWLTFAMVEEVRESRRQAATPVIRAGNGGGNMDSYSFPIENVGNTPAVNVSIGIRDSDEKEATVLTRLAIITAGQVIPLAVSLARLLGDTKGYQIVARYNNIYGEHFESVTVFPKARGTRLPEGPERHSVRRMKV